MQEGLTGLGCIVTIMVYDLFLKRDTNKISKRKGMVGEAGGKTVVSFQVPFPVDTHRICFLPSAISCDKY